MVLGILATGVALLAVLRTWERGRRARRREPLIHLRLLDVAPLPAGLVMFGFQNLILMGIFFAVPFYLPRERARTRRAAAVVV